MLDKKTLLRVKFAAALESNKVQQCTGMFYSKDARCAIGLGIDTAYQEGFKEYRDESIVGMLTVMHYHGNTFCEDLGLLYDSIVKDNDAGIRFKEIAAKLRSGVYDIGG